MKLTRKEQYLAGMRSGVPVIFGFVPVGIAFAIMARQAGFSALQTIVGIVLGIVFIFELPYRFFRLGKKS